MLGHDLQYKYYRYSLSSPDGVELPPDDHLLVFRRSIGRDDYGQFTEYRGKKNAVLMYLRVFRSDFAGLIGKHSTERQVTNYNEEFDETSNEVVVDNDYPHTAFVCLPRLRTIACVERASISANSAMERLHKVIAHRTRNLFIIEALRESQDLRKAVHRFRLTEVSFEVQPVNPHTGSLGRALDESRKLDHIRKIKGKVEAVPAQPLALQGGFLTQIQELQQSGHAKVGYRGIADHDIEVSVSKPTEPMALGDEGSEVIHGEELDVKVVFQSTPFTYPPGQGHVTQVRTIARRFLDDEQE